MAKPSEFQKQVITHIKTELGFWERSNDINSPSHHTSIESDMFVDFEDEDLDKVDEVIEAMRKLYVAVANLNKNV